MPTAEMHSRRTYRKARERRKGTVRVNAFCEASFARAVFACAMCVPVRRRVRRPSQGTHCLPKGNGARDRTSPFERDGPISYVNCAAAILRTAPASTVAASARRRRDSSTSSASASTIAAPSKTIAPPLCMKIAPPLNCTRTIAGALESAHAHANAERFSHVLYLSRSSPKGRR